MARQESMARPSSSSSTTAAAKPAASYYTIVFWIVASIGSSVGLIMTNKYVYKLRFTFVMTLTAVHFLVQLVMMHAMALVGVFAVKPMPMAIRLKMAALMVGSVGLMNMNLKTNSVGFYQVSKLLCIPCMVFVQTTWFGLHFSRKVRATLLAILVGVAMTMATDVTFTPRGLIIGLLAVVCTTLFQILVGSVQKDCGLEPLQLQYNLAMPLCVIAGATAYVTDVPEVVAFDYGQEVVTMILVSCAGAILVNLSSFAVTKYTSAVSYQVVGHFKTCLVLIGGFVFFPTQATSEEIARNLIGIAVAMSGVILYGHLKLTESQKPAQADWCDGLMPGMCLAFLHDGGGKQQYTAVSLRDDDNDHEPSNGTSSAVEMTSATKESV